MKNSQYKAAYKIGLAHGLKGRAINMQNSFGPIGIQGYNQGFKDGQEITENEDWHNKYKK